MFFEELYNPLNNDFNERLKEVGSLAFGKGRTILLKLNTDNIPIVIEKYSKWNKENNIFSLRTGVR